MLPDGALLVHAQVGWVSGHLGSMRQQPKEMLGLVASSRVVWELVEVLWVGGMATVCVEAACCGFCGWLLCTALLAGVLHHLSEH